MILLGDELAIRRAVTVPANRRDPGRSGQGSYFQASITDLALAAPVLARRSVGERSLILKCRWKTESAVKDMLQYLDEIVEPTIKDFEAHPTSRRHAFLACVATCHAVDYLAYPSKGTALRQKLSKRSADFQIVDEVGHAFKHVTTGDRNEPRTRMADVIARPPSFSGVMKAGLTIMGDKKGGVTIRGRKGINLLYALRQAVIFLRSQGDEAPSSR